MERPLTDFAAGFAHLHAAQPRDLEVAATKGVPWPLATDLARAMAVSEDVLADWLDASPSEVRGEAASGRLMPPPHGFMLLFIARLIGQAEATLLPTGILNGTPPAAWVGRWFQQPAEGLQGRTPSEFLCTPSRRRHLVDFLDRLDGIEQQNAAEDQCNVLLDQATIAGLLEVADGRVSGVGATVLERSSLIVPESFPRGGEGAVPGAQPKLVCRRINGRYVTGPTDDERAERHTACCHLITALVEYAERKQTELPGVDRHTLLRKIRDGVVAKGLDFSPTELEWVMARVAAELRGTA